MPVYCGSCGLRRRVCEWAPCQNCGAVPRRYRGVDPIAETAGELVVSRRRVLAVAWGLVCLGLAGGGLLVWRFLQ